MVCVISFVLYIVLTCCASWLVLPLPLLLALLPCRDGEAASPHLELGNITDAEKMTEDTTSVSDLGSQGPAAAKIQIIN